MKDETLPIERADLERAKDLLAGYPERSARDALHLAVMLRHDIRRILSFDRGFDSHPGVQRL